MIGNCFLDFPDSPSALRKSMLYDLPVEIAPNDITSDNENDKSVYEAHLSSNFQKVSLTMNEKEGMFKNVTCNKNGRGGLILDEWFFLFGNLYSTQL